MIVGWIAIGIALLSVLFTGVMAKLAFKEQKLRLRPHVYIEKQNVKVTDKALVFHMGMTNCGLSLARKTTISSELKLNGDVLKNLKPSITKHSIISPNQTIGYGFRLEEPTRSVVLQEEVKLTTKIEIRYQGNGKCYYFISTFAYNPRNNKCIVIEADAD